MASGEELYLDLMKMCLTRLVFIEGADDAHSAGWMGGVSRSAFRAIRSLAVPLYSQVMKRLPTGGTVIRGLVGPVERELKRRAPVDRAMREMGRDWPADAETMVGLARLDNLQSCVTDVIRRDVPGDLIETGVWRGGATIFMRAVLQAYGVTTRTVWVADSFRGLPKPDPKRAPADAGDVHWAFSELEVPLERVQANFARYGLLDNQVRFLVGWFKDTLPSAPIDRLAVLRLDGDLYESTMDATRPLYPKLSVGGYVIIDDYFAVPACKAAVYDYRTELGITDPIHDIDGTGVFWQRTS